MIALSFSEMDCVVITVVGYDADPVLEGYKTKLRQVTYDAGNNVDGSSIVLPWCDRFEKYDVDRSGLLDPTEFARCTYTHTHTLRGKEIYIRSATMNPAI